MGQFTEANQHLESCDIFIAIQYCGGSANQVHGVYVAWHGNRVSVSEESNDDVSTRVVDQLGYDEFNRLTSVTNQLNNQQLYSYVYDRYGNRWQQNALQGGNTSQLSFNKSNNHVSGYSYDAAGNMTSDGFHSYTYDAEGNIVQVDGGQQPSTPTML